MIMIIVLIHIYIYILITMMKMMIMRDHFFFLIGGFVEMATQTKAPVMINKNVQVNSSDLEKALLEYYYPADVNRAKDDIIIGVKKYAYMLRIISDKAKQIPIDYPTTAPDIGSRLRAIGPGFDHLNFPERRPGFGPKIIKDDLDRYVTKIFNYSINTMYFPMMIPCEFFYVFFVVSYSF